MKRESVWEINDSVDIRKRYDQGTQIQSILVPGGHLILRVNSVNDVNHGAGQGKEIEHHVYETESGTLKRFFDEEDIRSFLSDFELEYLKEETMSRYKFEKHLFRVCVRKLLKQHRKQP